MKRIGMKSYRLLENRTEHAESQELHELGQEPDYVGHIVYWILEKAVNRLLSRLFHISSYRIGLEKQGTEQGSAKQEHYEEAKAEFLLHLLAKVPESGISSQDLG